MSCSCRKGKRLSSLLTEEIGEFFRALSKNPKAFSLLLEVVNSFRPTDSPQVKAERVFLSVKDMVELGLISFSSAEKVLKVLKTFFHSGDRQRGDLLEVLVSKLGPFTFKGRFRRVNQCKVYKKRRKLSDKEIDVAFSGKGILELHECKANMVRQWRDPLRRGKRGSKLKFLNSLPLECSNGKKIVPCCSGLDGEFACQYVRMVLKFYNYRRIEVFGRRELLQRFREKLSRKG